MLTKIRSYLKSLEDHNEPTVAFEESRRLACVALMIEVAIIDQEFDERELASLKATLIKRFDIDAQDIDALISQAQLECDNATSLYQFTRTINDQCEFADKFDLLVGMWSIAFADGDLDKYEEYIIRKISDLLHLSHSDFIRAKQKAKREA